MSFNLNDTRLDSSSPAGGFNMLNYLEQLTPDGGSHGPNEGSYYCPACGAKNFKGNLKTGQYGTYGCNCACTEEGKQAIRNAVAPNLKKIDNQSTHRNDRKSKQQSDREKNRAAQQSAAQIDTEVNHYAVVVIEGCELLDQAEIKLSAWCRKHGHSELTAINSLRQRVKEHKPISDIEDRDLEGLKTIQGQRRLSNTYRVADLLPGALGAAVEHDAPILNVATLAFLAYILPLSGSLLPRKTRIIASPFSEPPIIWGGIIGASGSGKTRFKKSCTAWFNCMERLEYERYNTALEAHEANPGEVPRPAFRRRFLFGSATPEAVAKRLGTQADKGICWVKDELRGLFDGLDQYKPGGQGEGLSNLISTWDGEGQPRDLVDEAKSYYAYENNLCITGGIQPGVFRAAFSDPDDSQGLTARFMFLRVPVFPPRRTSGTLHLLELLPTIYEQLLKFPCEQVMLSPEADELFTHAIEESEALLSPDYPAITAWVRKLPAHLLRVVLVLHALTWVCNPQTTNPGVVSPETFIAAHQIVLACYESFALITREVDAGGDIAALLDKTLEAARQAGPKGISVRDLYLHKVTAIRSNAKLLERKPKDLALDICRKLASEGLGELDEPRKGSFNFTAYPDIAESL